MSNNEKNLEEVESESLNIDGDETPDDDVTKTIKELNERLQRALADYQNLERRTQVEITQRVSDKTNNLLLNFINIYEDFIRAEDSLSKQNIDTTGINAVRKNMENLLAENNIKSISAVGEIFDPEKHEAVSTVEDDSLDDGTIIQEVTKGYITEKGILKPSKVIVSKKK